MPWCKWYPAVVLLCVAYSSVSVQAATCKSKTASPAAAVSAEKQQYFYWNEINGDKQWEDPGDIPFEDDSRLRYWLTESGQRLSYDHHSYQYVWVELYSEELQRSYYYNQLTQETTWNKPADLAWRRVPVT